MSDIQMNELKTDGTNLRDYLIGRGATKAQMGAQVIPMIEHGMLNQEISSSETARASINKLCSTVSQTQQRVRNMGIDIRTMKSDCEELHSMIESAKVNARQNIINDPKSIDAVNVFTRVLQSAVDVLGDDKMTEAVCCKAIEAASYGAWRSIMGEK